MESKTVLDSGLHAEGSGFQLLDSGLCQWNLDFGFQSLVGFWISWTLYSGSKSQGSGFHKQKFPEYRNSDSLIWGDSYAYVTPSSPVLISVLCSLLFLYLRYAYSYPYDYACLLASLERTGLHFSTSDDRIVDIVEIPLKPYKPTFSRQENICDWNTYSLFIYWYTKISAIQCNRRNNWTTST